MLKPHCSEIYIYLFIYLYVQCTLCICIYVYIFFPLLADPGDLRITLR